eukprot:2147937-Amphidinium_carterae.1
MASKHDAIGKGSQKQSAEAVSKDGLDVTGQDDAAEERVTHDLEDLLGEDARPELLGTGEVEQSHTPTRAADDPIHLH